MSVAGLLGAGGTIQPLYLPTGPAPAHPYVENPFQDDVNGGFYDLSGVANLSVDGNGYPGAFVANSGPGARVVVKADGSSGFGLVVQPANQTTGKAAISLINGTNSINETEYIFYNPSVSGGVFTAGQLNLRCVNTGFPGDGANILTAKEDGSLIALGDASTVGGCVLDINGPSGISRVNDPIYNPAVAVAAVASGTASNIATDTTLNNVAAGKYQLQLTAETITPVAFSSLRMFAYPPPATTVINFSCTAITEPSDSTILGINSGIFTHAGGDLRVIVQSSAANWTASEWAVQLVRFQ